MAAYSVLVDSATHDDLSRGEVCTETTWVQIEAADETEAMLVAAQMSAGRGRIPTMTTPEY